MHSASLLHSLFHLSPLIRYVAVYVDGQLTLSARADLTNASSSESDKYEELIVNPTLLKLVIQRGNIDCGGAEYVLIRYGNFFEYVAPLLDGHLSVGLEPHTNPMDLVAAIHQLARSGQ